MRTCHHSGTVVLLAGLVFLVGCGGERGERPGWAEPNNPDYQSVKAGYREVAYEVRSVMSSAGHPILSFDQLVQEMRRDRPGLEVSTNGDNPFPGLLPSHRYLWLSSWPSSLSGEEVPLLWTTIRDDDSFVLSITTRGNIVPGRTNEFDRLLRRLIDRGAVLR
jgi:hypothetical protein